jgi:hypothetical protein
VPVAVKTPRALEKNLSVEARRSMFEEVTLMHSFEHENVVNLFGMISKGGGGELRSITFEL